ncbi:FecR domain-containing protein [Variovorax sp. J22R24]|uniref:FecR family protein n=1 Tax=Variovorax gracilis TaxID=3053502 RepID=UPI002576CEC1|nr:FecR domain-containing protein [Variovorax sp. J22R24]MDM0105208.1 FecR domain-containing protein [Variovorax sp. J22R24]
MNKRIAITLSGLFLAANTCALAQTAPAVASETAATSEARAGTLKSVRGDVRLLSADGAARAAGPGDAVAPIDRIVTGADSGASVVLRDGTSMVVGPSSRLDLKQFHFDATTQDGGMLVSLLRGSLRMITGLIGKTHPDAVRVETQTAVIGIRGTDFIVQVDGQP